MKHSRDDGEGRTEEDFRKRVIQDLERRGVQVINLRKGTFDAISDTTIPKMIEFKIMKPFHRLYELDLIASKDAIKFTEEQSSELKRARYNFPIVAVRDGARYYLLSPSFVRRKVGEKQRDKRNVMVSRRHFRPLRSLRYEQFISRTVRVILSR